MINKITILKSIISKIESRNRRADADEKRFNKKIIKDMKLLLVTTYNLIMQELFKIV